MTIPVATDLKSILEFFEALEMFAFVFACGAIIGALMYLWLLATSHGALRTKLLGMPIAFTHLLLSRDNKWSKPADPQTILLQSQKSPETCQRKRIYFVRHGESMWNEVFNRGLDIGIIWRFLSCVMQELNLLPYPDSVFWDSPLSPLGIRQAVQLSAWVEHSHPNNVHAAILRGTSDTQSVVCVSNLRRAVSTVLTGLSGRLIRNSKERVYITSSAQEITRNIDGYSLSPPGGHPTASWIEAQLPELDRVVSGLYSSDRLTGSPNKGNKPLFGSNGLKRMSEFCRFVFTSEISADKPTVILGGHSLWFREFFKNFLPNNFVHECKSNKIVNCGIVAFDLISVNNATGFVIDPESIQVVYGGFEDKKSKKN